MTDKPPAKAQANPSPISAVFVENESYLKRFLRRFLSRSQDIEDIVQDTYIKARCAEKGQVISSPKNFLFRIARNEALMALRKKSRRITDFLEELDGPLALDEQTSVEEQAIVNQKLGLFCQSVLEMPPQCRKVFLMCKVYGLSYREVAAQLDISVSGVEKHVAKGLAICNAYVDQLERQDVGSEPDKGGEKRQVPSNKRRARRGAVDCKDNYKGGLS